MRKPALIALTLLAAIPAALLCYVSISGIMVLWSRQQFSAKITIVLYLAALVSGLTTIWPPLWAIVWYGSPSKEAVAGEASAEGEGDDVEAAEDAGEVDAEADEFAEDADVEADEDFPEDDLDAFEGQPPPKDDSEDFEVSDDEVSQMETDDFQLDGDDEFADLDFDEEEAEEEEAPKAKSKGKAKDKTKKKKK